jgi:hypothetical protein
MCTYPEINSSMSSVCLECQGVFRSVWTCAHAQRPFHPCHPSGDQYLCDESISPSRDQHLHPEINISIWRSTSPDGDQYLHLEINISVQRSTSPSREQYLHVLNLSEVSRSVQECLDMCTLTCLEISTHPVCSGVSGHVHTSGDHFFHVLCASRVSRSVQECLDLCTCPEFGSPVSRSVWICVHVQRSFHPCPPSVCSVQKCPGCLYLCTCPELVSSMSSICLECPGVSWVSGTVNRYGD